MHKKKERIKKSKKKALLDLEFLVNLVRGVISLVVIFFIAAAIYNIFILDDDEDRVKENFLSLIETIEHMPPGYGPIIYDIDLGDAEDYTIVDTQNSYPSSTYLANIPNNCKTQDCLCLCEGKADECEIPIECKTIVSEIDKQQLTFHQYWWNPFPKIGEGESGGLNNFNSDYVEVYRTESQEEKAIHARVMLKRGDNEILICDAEACKDTWCNCFIGHDAKISKQTIENMKNAIIKCMPGLKSIGKLAEQENEEALKEKIKKNIASKLICSAEIKNTLITDKKGSAEGIQLIIKNKDAYLKYAGTAQVQSLNEEVKVGELQTTIKCIIYKNGEADLGTEEIIITPADKEITIVDVGIGQLCLKK